MLDYSILHKYPHTPHLPQSRSRTDDDRVLTKTTHLLGMDVVMSEKMDGENASLYNHHIHARSLDSRPRPDQDWVRRFWSNRRADIPAKWRVCGENLWAKHSIIYDNLPSYFLGFSIWNDENVTLGWDETLEWFKLLDIIPVRELYRGPYSDDVVLDLISKMNPDKQEGFVVRNINSFSHDDFELNAAKYVRPKHVQTDQHWLHGAITPNGLAPDGQQQ
jgi:hypothetical protein